MDTEGSKKEDTPEQARGAGTPAAGIDHKYSLSPEKMRLLDEIHSEGSDEALYFEMLKEIKELEGQDRQAVVKRALGKFNFFLHLTAYITGIAYLLLLGILVRSTLPYVFIPIALWTIGLGYHLFWAFFKKDQTSTRRKPKKPPPPPRKLIEDDADEAPSPSPSEGPDDEEHGQA